MSISKINDNSLQAICDVLGDTNSGLKGSEIGMLLSQLGIPDPTPGITKKYRLFEALNAKQDMDDCGNYVMTFIKEAMDPVRYRENPDLYEYRRNELNTVLAFLGYKLSEDGQIRVIQKAKTLSEAQNKAILLRKRLTERGVHSEVLKFCRAELLQENYFHAVFEATKSVADIIRDRTGLTGDGTELIDKAFGGKTPMLAINSLRSETEQSEQKGFANLIKGLFGTFRNVTAHAPKIKWPIDEQDALDLLSLVSYVHRRLDSAVLTGYI